MAAQGDIRQVDVGCVAEAGSFSRSSDGVAVRDGHALMSFLLELLHRLQSLGPVPAIDYVEWGEAGSLG